MLAIRARSAASSRWSVVGERLAGARPAARRRARRRRAPRRLARARAAPRRAPACRRRRRPPSAARRAPPPARRAAAAPPRAAARRRGRAARAASAPRTRADGRGRRAAPPAAPAAAGPRRGAAGPARGGSSRAALQRPSATCSPAPWPARTTSACASDGSCTAGSALARRCARTARATSASARLGLRGPGGRQPALGLRAAHRLGVDDGRARRRHRRGWRLGCRPAGAGDRAGAGARGAPSVASTSTWEGGASGGVAHDVAPVRRAERPRELELHEAERAPLRGCGGRGGRVSRRGRP